MNCLNHPEMPAVAYCRTCGKPVCQACQRVALGTIFCAEHAPAENAAPSTPPPATNYVPPAATGTSPGLAFVLGLIPGVGAIYNGQYAKGVVHGVIFGLLISILSSNTLHGMEPLFSLLLAVFYFYMPFEAYHTARKRQLGLAVDEFSSIFPMKTHKPGLPIGPIALIGLGVLFLLDTMDLLRFRDIARFWPVVLIVLGAYMLYVRISGGDGAPSGTQEVPHEH